MGKVYPTDLTDAQWAILEPLLPTAKPGAGPGPPAVLGVCADLVVLVVMTFGRNTR